MNRHRVTMRIRGAIARISRWRHIGHRRIRVMRKLDESKVRWIIRRKLKGDMTNREIAETAGVSVIWVKKLWARYRHTRPADIAYPARMGRPENGLYGRREHSAVLSASALQRQTHTSVRDVIGVGTGLNIPHSTIRRVMADDGLSARQPNKSRRRKGVRYERTYSNSMWHTDYKLLGDGRWFIAYEDDASRFITGYGVFGEATTAHAIDVLHKAIKDHGRPASILSDHGTQFYANESRARRRGESAFEKELVRLGIKHVLARVGHPQTNGKLERFHGELHRKLHTFAAVPSRGEDPDAVIGGPFHTGRRTDPVEQLVRWYNHDRPHMSLDWDRLETPAQAFERKMAPAGATVIDEETGEEYDITS